MVRKREGGGARLAGVTLATCFLAGMAGWGAGHPNARPQPNPVPRSTGASGTDDIELIRQRLKADFANPRATYPHDVRASSSNVRPQDWLATLAPDGHWPDLESGGRRAPNAGAYSNPGTPSFHSNAHLIRLAQMTSAYAIVDTPDYHSPKLLDGVERALAYWYKNHTLSENWWDNTVGEPQLLSRTLVPLMDVLPADLLRQGLTYYIIPQVKDPGYSHSALSYPQQQLIRGALTCSAEDIAEASAEMQRILRIHTDEGVQRDWSFHQHGPQLYNGGYGLTLMVDEVNYARVLAGTRYAFAHDKLMFLADHLLEGDGHMIRGKALDYSAFGRTLLRRGGGQSAVELEDVCDQLAALLPERAAELMTLEKHIEGTGAPYSYLGNTYFWNSDFMTHQREAYYISVKMVSNRTVGTETIHAENMNGRWLPFGATWILRRGDEYNNILLVLDWGRVPGATSAHEVMPPIRNVSQPEGFVGGVSDGNYGAASMIFTESDPTPLASVFKIMTQGRKSWFFFDREIVALGAGISSVRDAPVGTTINQTGLRGTVLVDGHAAEPGESTVPATSWVLHDGVGYAFPNPTSIRLKIGPQKGEVRPGPYGASGTTPVEQVFTLWLEHGIHPHDARYAYVIVPGVTEQQMPEWAAHPPVRIIRNSPALQAVMHEELGIAEIVFYTPGTVELGAGWNVKVNHPCLVLLAKSRNGARVAVSSPGGEFFSVDLNLTSHGHSEALTFELPGGDMAGKSQIKEVRFQN